MYAVGLFLPAYIVQIKHLVNVWQLRRSRLPWCSTQQRTSAHEARHAALRRSAGLCWPPAPAGARGRQCGPTSRLSAALLELPRHCHWTQARKPLTCVTASGDARQRLLYAINAKKGDEDVIAALRELAKENSTAGAARSPALAGRWNLLWASSNAEARFCNPRIKSEGCRRVP